jgi:Dullard-like phosphatase family protein
VKTPSDREAEQGWTKDRAMPSFVTQAQPPPAIEYKHPDGKWYTVDALMKSGFTHAHFLTMEKRTAAGDDVTGTWHGACSDEHHGWHGYGSKSVGRASSPRLCPSTSLQQPAVHAVTGRRKTLVLDLDETLIHAYFEPCAADIKVPMTMDGVAYTAYVMKRPGCEEFLRKAVSLFDVIVWTASLECYAAGVIDRLEQISGCGRLPRMYRESCTKVNGSHAKDLRKIGVPLSDVAILDNSPHVAVLNKENLINIRNFYDDKSDRELYNMLHFLDQLAEAPTVFDAIR